jgi:multiple sugar transport system ATP-binding protein
MVYVTHDQVEAMTLGDKIVVLSEGRVQQAGTPLTLYQQPANRFVATFIGSPTINLLPANVLEVSAQGVQLRLGNGASAFATVNGSALQPGETVEIGVRPEHCEVLQAGARPQGNDLLLNAEITLVEHLGESNLLYVRTEDGQDLILRGDGNADVSLGDSLLVRASPQALHLFRADGSSCLRLHPGNMRAAHAR